MFQFFAGRWQASAKFEIRQEKGVCSSSDYIDNVANFRVSVSVHRFARDHVVRFSGARGRSVE